MLGVYHYQWRGAGLCAVRSMHLLACGHVRCGASGLLRRPPFAPSRGVRQDYIEAQNLSLPACVHSTDTDAYERHDIGEFVLMQHQPVPYRIPFAELCSEQIDLPFIASVHVWLLRAHSLQYCTSGGHVVGQTLFLMKTRQRERFQAHLQRALMMCAIALGNDNPHSRAVWNLKHGMLLMSAILASF